MNEQILIGTLLGDASVPRLQGRSKSYRVTWEHSLAQKEYAIWKAENSLDNFSTYERSREDDRTGNTYSSITIFSTKGNYSNYRDLFYFDNTKKVSELVLSMLTPLSIAVWFMDDGSLYYNGNSCHLTLSVNGFDEESVDRIIRHFRNNYDIGFKKSGGAIRLTSVREVNKFESNFAMWYHPSMNYKRLFYAKQVYNNGK